MRQGLVQAPAGPAAGSTVEAPECTEESPVWGHFVELHVHRWLRPQGLRPTGFERLDRQEHWCTEQPPERRLYWTYQE